MMLSKTPKVTTILIRIFIFALMAQLLLQQDVPLSLNKLDASASKVNFQYPVGVAVDTKGNLYVADSLGQCLWVIKPNGDASQLGYTAISGYYGGYRDGPVTQAQFTRPEGVAVDTRGNVYVADSGNYRIRRISLNGIVTTLAGAGKAGHSDGAGTQAAFEAPVGIAVDASGVIYVADYNCIRRIGSDGRVSTLGKQDYISMELDEGKRVSGYIVKPDYKDGPINEAQFENVRGIAVDRAGSIYVTEIYANRIRRISQGRVGTLTSPNGQGYKDGPLNQAQFYNLTGIAVDDKGNIYVADSANHCIRHITPKGIVKTIAGNGTPGYRNGAASAALFCGPLGVAVDPKGTVYVADTGNKCIRRITTDGVVSTVAGTCSGCGKM